MLPQKSDLIKHIIQGDKDSFEKVFYELFPKLYHFSYDFVKDKEIAREIVHESFIKLWESSFTLKPDSNLEAFLVTICRNKCLNFLKHKKIILHYQEIKNGDQIELDLLSGVLTESSFNQIDYDILKDKLNNAIHNLPDQCRKVFELSRFKRKKYSEIATILNISIKTVEAHISVALRKLKEDLKDFL